MRPPRSKAPLCAIAAVAGLAACDSDLGQRLQIAELGSKIGITDPDNDPSITRISTDATIPILLASNKPETTFTVNGTSLSPAKMLKVMVPRRPLEITAQAPCYRTLVQRAEADKFGRLSLFQFTFANWDRVPGARGVNCA